MLQKTILVIEDTEDVIVELNKKFKKDTQYAVISCNTQEINIKQALLNMPDIVIINETPELKRIFAFLKSASDMLMTPLIYCSSKMLKKDILDVLALGVDQYITKPVDNEYLYHVVVNLMNLIYMNRTVSSLTGLPGNIQITNELKKRLIKKTKFSVLYLDLDNFKAYNDTYGFLRGDDVIQLTADIIITNIKQYGLQGDFVGHIGGDDFVAITDSDKIQEICVAIVNDFDKQILKLLSKSDKERGFFEVPNRKGIIEQYPLTSISIGVVTIEEKEKIDILEIGEIGAQVKHKAKTIPGSAYVINTRI